MKKGELIANVLIGTVYKIMKNNLDYSKFKDEFKLLRHSKIEEFSKLITNEKSDLYVMNIKTLNIKNNSFTQNEDGIFIMLMNNVPSFNKFIDILNEEYGDFIDNDFTDDMFCKFSEFELALRVHADNNEYHDYNDKLINIINFVSEKYMINVDEIEKLHNSRKFLNKIKHQNSNYSLCDNVNIFLEGYKVLDKYKIHIL